MASKSNNPFLIYLLGAKDAGKSMYAASLAALGRTGARMEYRGQIWTLAFDEPLDGWKDVDGRPYNTTPVVPQTIHQVTSPTEPIIGPGLYSFTLTRKIGNERASQSFILLDPPGGFPVPQTAKDRENQTTGSLTTIWKDCNIYSKAKFGQPLTERVDALLFINGQVFPQKDLLKKNKNEVIEKLFAYLVEPLKLRAPGSGSLPFVAHFILYHTASEFLVSPMANETIESKLIQINKNPVERANNYRSRVDQDYQDFVSAFMEKYKPVLQQHTNYRIDADPFFGSPVGQTIDGQRNWSFRTNTFVDRACWQPLFVLEPIIELVRLSWGEPG